MHDRVYVDADNRGGAREAVRHLVSLGRERVATITGPVDREASAFDRLEGYRDVLPDAPPLLVEHSDYTRQGGFDAMAALLDRCPGLDAVFVASDLMASGALQVLRERGRRVPDDVAVVGFDDLAPIAEHTDPPLTTVHQDIEGMGRLMARLLFSRTEEQVDGGAPAAGHSCPPWSHRRVWSYGSRPDAGRRSARSHSPARIRPACGITFRDPDRESIRCAHGL